MKVLVTGGCGFIGSNFIRYLLKTRPDIQVINLDKLTYAGNLENLIDVQELYPDRYTFIRGDICDRELVCRILKDYEIEAIVNFAAQSHVDRSILSSEDFIQTNVQGTRNLMDCVRECVKDLSNFRFIQISTDEVYGSLGEEGYFTEESPLLPNNPYAASKAAADLLVRAYYRTYGFPAIITRSSNNYGPYQFPEKLIPLMILKALKDEPLPVYGDGRNVRDWLYVEDNCRAIALVLERGKIGEIYNIGGGCEKRNIEVVKLILKLLDKPETLITFVEDRPGHDWRYALDWSKIRDQLGWEPVTSFEEGLSKTVKWYLEHQAWVENVISGEYQRYYEKIYGNRKVLGRYGNDQASN